MSTLYIICRRYTVKNNFIRILGPVLNHFFLILEKPIAHRGNLFAQPRKDFFFLYLGIFPPKVQSRKFRVRFPAREATKILDEFPAGKLKYPGILPLYS
jgi:hypothetical protein